MARNLVVLGSTGSIGRQTLDVVRSCGDRIQVFGLAAQRNSALLQQQAQEFGAQCVVLVDPDAEAASDFPVLRSADHMTELASRPEVDLVVVATSGTAGLLPSLAALRAGKLVALANKETLVMAGSVIRDELARGKGSLVPIDSEHSAIWQCLQGEPTETIERLTLTASGGALRHLSDRDLVDVTPEQALQHPNWSMGRKITVDSANLMNKGLEVIEAQWLFELSIDQIEVVIHHQSIIHSLVTFADGSTKAQLGYPDMRLPIQYALSHPDRWSSTLPRLDLTEVGTFTFAAVDFERYPALRLALQAARQGGTYPAVLSSADEVAVEAFLQRRIRFVDIPAIVEETLAVHTPCGSANLDDILESDRWARAMSERLIAAKRA